MTAIAVACVDAVSIDVERQPGGSALVAQTNGAEGGETVSRWIEPSATWLLAPVGVLLIGYTAANAAGVLPAAILVAVIAATLAFIHPARWALWGLLAAVAVPTGHASAAVAGMPIDPTVVPGGLSMIAAMVPGLLGALAGRALRTRIAAPR